MTHPLLTLVRSAVERDPVASAPAVIAHDCSAGSQTVRDRAWPIHVAAYLLTVECEYSQRAAALLIGRSPKLIRYAIPGVENRRDDPAFDAWLDDMGEQARGMVV